MRAGKAASAAGVTVKALRDYESLGLLQPVRRPNGYREYSAEDIRMAAEVRALASLGRAARETRPFLECLRGGHEVGDECPESLAAYRDKIERLDTFIARLTATRHALVQQMHRAAERGLRSHGPPPEPPEGLPRPDELPANLPAAVDDGAARHLPGSTLPALTFRTTDGDELRLDAVSTGRWVLFLYPLTGEPGVDMPRGWDEIPGARGCSQEACDFRDHFAALRVRGVREIIALSTDRAEYQRDLVRRLRLPYRMLSDPALSLGRELGLPTSRPTAWCCTSASRWCFVAVPSSTRSIRSSLIPTPRRCWTG